MSTERIDEARAAFLADLESAGADAEAVEKVLVNKVEPLKEELKTFIECVKDGKQFPITPEQAVLNVRIVEKIRRDGGGNGH